MLLINNYNMCSFHIESCVWLVKRLTRNSEIDTVHNHSTVSSSGFMTTNNSYKNNSWTCEILTHTNNVSMSTLLHANKTTKDCNQLLNTWVFKNATWTNMLNVYEFNSVNKWGRNVDVFALRVVLFTYTYIFVDYCDYVSLLYVHIVL